FIYQRSGAEEDAGPTHEFDFGFEYVKTITYNTAVIADWGWNVFRTSGAKTHTGFENLAITGKWQAYTDPQHEFVVSLGIIRVVGWPLHPVQHSVSAVAGKRYWTAGSSRAIDPAGRNHLDLAG